MKDEQLEVKVIAMIAKKLGKKENEVSLSSRLVEDLNADSLDIVELLMLLEDEYGIVIADEDAVKLNTIGDVVNYISSQTKK